MDFSTINLYSFPSPEKSIAYPTDSQERTQRFFSPRLTFLESRFRMSAGCQRKTIIRPTRHFSRNAADLGSATGPACCTDGDSRNHGTMAQSTEVGLQRHALTWSKKPKCFQLSHSLSCTACGPSGLCPQCMLGDSRC